MVDRFQIKVGRLTVRRLVLIAAAILLAINFTVAFAQVPSAADEMHAGIVAYKFLDYSVAAEHFKTALEINPDLTQARLFLAAAYAQQYIVGDDSAANVAMAEQAIDEFKKVLNAKLTETDEYKAVVPLASLSFNLERFNEAREYYGRAIALKPTEAHNYFMIGLIDGTEASVVQNKARSEMGLSESQMISKPEACVSLRAQNQPKVEDGMRRLQKALELQPDSDEAMGYMNLLYRERAEYECDDPEARKADLKAADEWTDKAIAAKKANAEKSAAEKPPAKQP